MVDYWPEVEAALLPVPLHYIIRTWNCAQNAISTSWSTATIEGSVSKKPQLAAWILEIQVGGNSN